MESVLFALRRSGENTVEVMNALYLLINIYKEVMKSTLAKLKIFGKIRQLKVIDTVGFSLTAVIILIQNVFFSCMIFVCFGFEIITHKHA